SASVAVRPISVAVFSWTVAEELALTGCDQVLNMCQVVLKADPSKSPVQSEKSGPHAAEPGSSLGVSLTWIAAARLSRIAAVLLTKLAIGGSPARVVGLQAKPQT